MSVFITYLKDYVRWIDKRIFALSAFFMASAIFANYHFYIDYRIGLLPEAQQLFSWYLIFLVCCSFPYLLKPFFVRFQISYRKPFLLLHFTAPAIFAWKMAGNIHFTFTDDESSNAFWNSVAYWPFKLIIVTFALFILWRLFHKDQPFYGLTAKNLHTRVYFFMLLMMVPLIAAAAIQPDFQTMYPRLHNIEHLLEENSGWKKLVYELSYGSDFFTIELFFRGFLILAFTKWVGKDAILPMALFYCSIHFGKPLGECISSFFGGIVLGVVTYHTRSIYGGLIVHLGIAWLMELAGYISGLMPR